MLLTIESVFDHLSAFKWVIIRVLITLDIIISKPDATEDEIKRSFKKLALKWHPDRNPDNIGEAERKFKELTEAYEVLSNPGRRAMYDQYGEEAISNNAEKESPNSSSGSNRSFGNGNGNRTFFFRGNHPRAAEEIFREFFANDGFGFGGFGGFGRSRFPSAFDTFGFPDFDGEDGARNHDGGKSSSTSTTANNNRNMNGNSHKHLRFSFTDTYGTSSSAGSFFVPPKPKVLKTKLSVTLEELYVGTTKKLQVIRTLLDQTKVECILTIEVKPGWKHGTTMVFEDAGDELSPGVSQDIQLEIEQKPHPRFNRVDDNLHTTVVITLAEALTGFQKGLTSLDGRMVAVISNGDLEPGDKLLIPGEGMPIAQRPGQKGNLVVEFKVVYPKKLTLEQKALIRDILV